MKNQQAALIAVSGVALCAVVGLAFTLGRSSGRGAEREDIKTEIRTAIGSPVLDAERASVTAKATLQMVGLSIMLFAQANRESFPTMVSIAELKASVTKPADLSQQEWEKFTDETHRLNTALSKIELAQLQNPSTMPMVWQAIPDVEDRRAVLFTDGHVQRMSTPKWNDIARAAGVTP